MMQVLVRTITCIDLEILTFGKIQFHHYPKFLKLSAAPFSSFRSATTILAPTPAKSLTVSAPIPIVAPVTITPLSYTGNQDLNRRPNSPFQIPCFYDIIAYCRCAHMECNDSTSAFVLIYASQLSNFMNKLLKWCV